MPMSLMQNASEVAAAEAAQARGAAQGAAQQARQAAQQARDAAENARDVARAEREAAKAEQEANQIAGGSTGVVTITRGGVTTVLTDASPEAIATALGLPDGRDRESTDWIAIPVMGILSTAAILITALVLRYRIRMRGSSSAALPPDLTDHLSRMEAGIDAMAVEVERISEGQRFTTRLLSERPVEEVRRG